MNNRKGEAKMGVVARIDRYGREQLRIELVVRSEHGTIYPHDRRGTWSGAWLTRAEALESLIATARAHAVASLRQLESALRREHELDEQLRELERRRAACARRRHESW